MVAVCMGEKRVECPWGEGIIVPPCGEREGVECPWGRYRPSLWRERRGRVSLGEVSSLFVEREEVECPCVGGHSLLSSTRLVTGPLLTF